MSVIKLSNGGSLIEERFSFPDPDMTIRTVSRFEDIKYLKARNASELASIIYFYGDKDYFNNLTHYTGETQNSPLSRYKSTHSKKEWCQNLKYPLIGMAESSLMPWDMETRKTIEALCAYKMKQAGFSVINADTMNWSHGVVIPPSVNAVYTESVANIIVSHQIALLGLSGINVKNISRDLGILEDEEEDYTPDENIKFTMSDFANPSRIKTEEKMKALIKSGQVIIGEPLYTNHKTVHKAVILRSPDSVEYRGVLYKPREAIKAMAHEAYSEGLTIRQVEGWNSYDPFSAFSVDRNEDRIRLLDLWNIVKPNELDSVEEADEIVDEEWFDLVNMHGLVGSSLICNNKEAKIGKNGLILLEELSYTSLTAFGDAVGGLDETGWGNFVVIHEGETYTIKSD